MALIPLTSSRRRQLRADAHHVQPVVMVGGDGLTPAVMKECDAALASHGLIKVRLLAGDRSGRDAMLLRLADELNAAPVQHIGKLLILWREPNPKEKPVDPERRAGPRDFKVLKYSSRGGQRPEVKTLRVLGNQRLTSGGKVKRARPTRPPSIKRTSQS